MGTSQRERRSVKAFERRELWAFLADVRWGEASHSGHSPVTDQQRTVGIGVESGGVATQQAVGLADFHDSFAIMARKLAGNVIPGCRQEPRIAVTGRGNPPDRTRIHAVTSSVRDHRITVVA